MSDNEEEFKDDEKLNANYYSSISNNQDTKMEDDVKNNYMS